MRNQIVLLLLTAILFSCSTATLFSCSGSEEQKDDRYEIETTIPDVDTTTVDEKTEEKKDVVTIKPGGEYKEHHPNGQLKIEGQYDMESKRTGLWISYYDNGTKWSESYYVKGEKDGHSITFFPNGQPRYVGEYAKDKKTGTWTFYDEEGNIVKEETY